MSACLLCRKGRAGDDDSDSDSDDDESSQFGRLTPYQGQHVHTECLLFHKCIAAAAGDQVDAESLVRDNPELRDKAISEALATVCDACGQTGASVEIERSRGIRSKKTRLHLPCAHVRGNEIRGLGDGNYPKIVLPLPQDEVGDDEADGSDKGEDDGRGEDDLSAGGAQGAVPREVDASPSRQSPSHAQADSHGSAPGGAEDHGHGMERSLDSEEQGAGGPILDSDGDSANRSTTLGKRQREEGGENEENECDDDGDNEVLGEDEGQPQVVEENDEVRYEELSGRQRRMYDVVRSVVQKGIKNCPDVEKKVDELFRMLMSKKYMTVKALTDMTDQAYTSISKSFPPGHVFHDNIHLLDKLKKKAVSSRAKSKEEKAALQAEGTFFQEKKDVRDPVVHQQHPPIAPHTTVKMEFKKMGKVVYPQQLWTVVKDARERLEDGTSELPKLMTLFGLVAREFDKEWKSGDQNNEKRQLQYLKQRFEEQFERWWPEQYKQYTSSGSAAETAGSASSAPARAAAPAPSRTSTLGANKNKTSAPPAPNPPSKGSAPPTIRRKSETSQASGSQDSEPSRLSQLRPPALQTSCAVKFEKAASAEASARRYSSPRYAEGAGTSSPGSSRYSARAAPAVYTGHESGKATSGGSIAAERDSGRSTILPGRDSSASARDVAHVALPRPAHRSGEQSGLRLGQETNQRQHERRQEAVAHSLPTPPSPAGMPGGAGLHAPATWMAWPQVADTLTLCQQGAYLCRVNASMLPGVVGASKQAGPAAPPPVSLQEIFGLETRHTRESVPSAVLDLHCLRPALVLRQDLDQVLARGCWMALTPAQGCQCEGLDVLADVMLRADAVALPRLSGAAQDYVVVVATKALYLHLESIGVPSDHAIHLDSCKLCCLVAAKCPSVEAALPALCQSAPPPQYRNSSPTAP